MHPKEAAKKEMSSKAKKTHKVQRAFQFRTVLDKRRVRLTARGAAAVLRAVARKSADIRAMSLDSDLQGRASVCGYGYYAACRYSGNSVSEVYFVITPSGSEWTPSDGGNPIEFLSTEDVERLASVLGGMDASRLEKIKSREST